jgi:hypothetical protein
VLSFRRIRIGREASIGPYAVLQKGTIVDDGAVILPLQKTEPEKSTYQTKRTSGGMKVIRISNFVHYAKNFRQYSLYP